MMYSRTFAGMNLLPTTPSIMASISRCASRLMGESRHVRPSDPRRLEVRPERNDQQHAEAWYPVRDATEQFEGRGVGPMCIFENHQCRILAREGRD
jgi:hypothetical protein